MCFLNISGLTMGPPNKKQKTAAYKTCPPLNRGKSAKNHEGALEPTALHKIAAIASANQVATVQVASQKHRGNKVIDEITLIIASDHQKRKYLKEAESALKKWYDLGTIPDQALDHLEKHYSEVWPTIPFVNRIIRERQQRLASQAAADSVASVSEPPGSAPAASVSQPPAAASPTEVGEPIAGPSFEDDTARAGCSRMVTTRRGHTFTEDLFDPNHEMWVDDPYDFEFSSDEDEEKQLSDLLDRATVEFLHATNRKKQTVTWERLMQHWFTDAQVALEYIDKILRWIKRHNAVLTEHQIKKLPKTGRTFLKITNTERKAVMPIKARDHSGAEIGLYMHYGMMTGVFGTSPSEYISTTQVYLVWSCTVR